MSTDIATADLVIVDADTDFDTTSFGKEVGKTLVISTAATAGIVTGIILVATLAPKVKKLLSRAKDKTEAVAEDVVHDITDAPQKD